MKERDTKLNPLDLLINLFSGGRGAFALDAAAWQTAYDDLCRRAEAGEETQIDPNVGESPVVACALSCGV